MCEDGLVWIFGYGSLIWRSGFSYIRKLNVCIKGYMRRFWQGSTDHRGVPGNPGRVVTLIPNEKGVCWGTCYCVSESDAKIILSGLDYREKGGYERKEVDVYLNELDQNPIVEGAVVYIGTSDNTEYLGEAPILSIAKTIYTSIGPSGPNIDYFNNLLKSMREMNVFDEHVEEISKQIEYLSLHNNTTTTQLKSSIQQNIQFNSTSISNTTTTIITPIRIDKNEIMQGKIIIDHGAVQAISNLAKSLLSVGIISVEALNEKNDFQPGSFVNVCDKQGLLIAKGKVNYSLQQINKIIGKNSQQINEIFHNESGNASTINQSNGNKEFEHEGVVIFSHNMCLF